MRSIVITGANRGLGLGLVKHLARSRKPPEYVFATTRSVKKAVELNDLAAESKNIHIIEMDVTDTKTHETAVNIVKEKVGESGLNVLFNNAGVSSKFTRLPFVKESQMMENLLVNTVAPIMLTKAFLPLLRQAAANTAAPKGFSVERAAIINMSSILGSISRNDDGGFYPYRCSKAALNAATKSMSIDLKDSGILAISLHPGWVRTDMGGNNAPMGIDESIQSILNTLEKLTEKDTGSYLQHDGTILPW